MGICQDVQRTNYKGQFRSSARHRLAILNGCGGAAGNFQIVPCPLYIVLSNINLSSRGGASPKMLLIFLLPTKSWGYVDFGPENCAEKRKNIKFCLDFGVAEVYTALTATLRAVPEKEKAPVAQLDRASDYGSEGLRFESPRACFS